MVRTFRDLLIWQKAMDLSTEVYAFTRQLPKTEQYGLIAQLQRSSVSIASNIAEGFGRRTKRDFRRFLRISMGSLFELQTQIELVYRIYSKEEINDSTLFQNSRELERMLSSFIRTL